VYPSTVAERRTAKSSSPTSEDVILFKHSSPPASKTSRTRIDCRTNADFECSRGGSTASDHFTADVVYFISDFKTTPNETIDEQREKTKNSHQKLLALVTMMVEAPPCRNLPPDVCSKFDYRVTLATTPDVDISVSFALLSIPPSSGWYDLEPDSSCLRGAVASVGAPSHSGYLLRFAQTCGYNITTASELDSINPPPTPDQNDGHFIRGYWMWELATRFPGVINYNGSTWIQVQAQERNKSPNDPTRHNLTKCFPAE
jgi:hypothetical protein